MGGGRSGAVGGVLIGIAIAFLGQQFGYLDMGPLETGVINLFAFAFVGGLVFGLIGHRLGRSPPPSGVAEWNPEHGTEPKSAAGASGKDQ